MLLLVLFDDEVTFFVAFLRRTCFTFLLDGRASSDILKQHPSEKSSDALASYFLTALEIRR